MIEESLFFSLIGLILFCVGLAALILHPHLVRKILAANIMSSGVFLVFVALAYRASHSRPDPVPHAMVLTGIVVSVCMTALALGITRRIHKTTGRASLEETDTE